MYPAAGTGIRNGTPSRGRPAFTLIELLVVMAIVATLLALLLPALNTARKQMLGLQCASKMRTIAFDFQLFAENLSAHGRGESEALGKNFFHANDFLESVYRIDEFWDLPQRSEATLSASQEPILCPSGPSELKRVRGGPCDPNSLQPAEDITIALNMRLYRAAIMIGGRLWLAPVSATVIRNNVLNRPYVPLMIEVDGRAAFKQERVDPFYIAPPLKDRDDPYAEGRYWSPSKRHRGRTNVAFVGGHVLSSEKPADEAWDWSYQADIKR